MGGGAVRGFFLLTLLVLAMRRGQGPLKAVVLSSLLFGVLHLAGILGADQPEAAVVQAIFAGLYGILLGALLLRTNALWLLALAHGLIDLPRPSRSRSPPAGR